MAEREVYMNKLYPYIGMDVISLTQVKEMTLLFEACRRRNSVREFHAGVMMSYKTLNGIPSSYDNSFVKKENVHHVFSSGCIDVVYNCLHYIDYDEHPEFPKHLARALSYGCPGIHAVQLDMIWPDPAEIVEGLRIFGREVEVILQVGGRALAQIGDDPNMLVRKLRLYNGVIHRVLLDESGGRGKVMNADRLLPYFRAIRQAFPDMGLVAAGGLGVGTTHLAEPLLREFPDMSFDAQGRLRKSGDLRDPHDTILCEGYTIDMLRLTEKYD